MLDSTTNSLAEVAGDGPRLGGGLDDDEAGHWPNRVTTASRGASRAGERILRADDPPAEAQLALLARRGLSWPVLQGRLPAPRDGSRARPRRRLRRSPRTTGRTSTRGRSACRSFHAASCASWPSRSSSGRRSAGSCAPEADSACDAASATSRRSTRPFALCREGHAVVMFPEGTRRSKGLRKKYEARWHTGAARIALEAGVPLVPAGISGTERLGRLGPLRVAYGPPVETDRPRGARRRRGGAGGDRPAARGDHRAGGLGEDA